MAYPAETIANVFIEFAKQDGKPLSNMKLQKLLYLAQGHSYSLRNEELISDDAEAWDYGPVYPDVYRACKHYGAGNITGMIHHPFFDPDDEDDEDPWTSSLAENDRTFVRAVWNAYKEYTAIQLSELSHVPNGPWSRAKRRHPSSKSTVIEKQEIAEYFKTLKKSRG